jgi:6-phosphogluconolactonase
MDSVRPELRLLDGPAAVAAAAAVEFRAQIQGAYRRGKVFSCALSGGTTPQLMFHELGSEAGKHLLPSGIWGLTHFFWGDERDVPPDDPASNYRSAREALLDRIGIPPGNIHRIMPEKESAVIAAEEYEVEIRGFFSLSKGELPRFDLVFLGMGEDGHTASIFPYSDVVHENSRLVSAPWVPKLNAFRVTLTPPVINNAACIIVLVTGAAKAEAVKQVLQGPYLPEQFPAQIVRPESGRLIWILDRAAASKLSDRSQKNQREKGSGSLSL